MTSLLVLLLLVLGGAVLGLRKRVSRLEAQQSAILTRLAEFRDQNHVTDAIAAPAPEKLAPAVGAEETKETVVEAQTEQIPAAVITETIEASRPVAPTAQPATTDPAHGIETALGTKWAVWVGGLALALGGLFLVRYSIEAGWFGPAARIALASVFGLVLLGAGEFVRRTGFKIPVEGIASAYVPSILTAAGAFTLFGAIYAAHGVYEFIGPTVAFTLLAAVGIGTIGLALLHGLPLAGLGLLGSLLTPMLVHSQSANAWALFVYLAIVLVAAVAVSRIRTWPFLAAAAFAGVGLWVLIYLVSATVDGTVVLFICAVMIAALIFLWQRSGEADVEWAYAAKTPHIVVALFCGLAALLLSRAGLVSNVYFSVAIIAMLVAAAAWSNGSIALLFGAGVAASLVLAPAAELSLVYPPLTAAEDYANYADISCWSGILLGLLFLGVGLWKARQSLPSVPVRSCVWISWAAVVPLVAIGSLWWSFGNPNVDFATAAAAGLLATVLAAAGEWLAQAEEPPYAGGPAISAALIGGALAFAMAVHAAFGPAATTIIIGASAALPALATRWRTYPVLGWLAVGAFGLTLARVAIQPTIVQSFELSSQPVFNMLLPGYGVPALAFAYAAWQLARTTNGRPRLAMEVAAVLFAMLTVAMLVRHAMTDGDMYSATLTLAEQAIYTLMALGFGASLIAIGQRAPSAVMTVGSMILGCLSTAMIALLHFALLNPLATDESTGRIPFFNLLFLAYLLPGVAAGAVALYARGKRPQWYPAMLGLVGAALAFGYLTLSVRRWYQGEYIGWWRATTQLETYTYSALWMAFGVVLLVLGVRLRSYTLRVASAVLISLAVLKVFVLDMSALEGVLRALSFIGLGAILIGIGLFYQRLLARTREAEPSPTPPEPAPAAPPPAP